MTKLDWERVNLEDLIRRREEDLRRNKGASLVHTPVNELTSLTASGTDKPKIKCYYCSALVPKSSIDQHIETLHLASIKTQRISTVVLEHAAGRRSSWNLNIVFTEENRRLACSLREHIAELGFNVKIIRRSKGLRHEEHGFLTFTEYSSDQLLKDLHRIVTDLQRIFPVVVVKANAKRALYADPTIWLGKSTY